jgi:hypothetical protein
MVLKPPHAHVQPLLWARLPAAPGSAGKTSARRRDASISLLNSEPTTWDDGVETAGHLVKLLELGVGHARGLFYRRPALIAGC